MLYRVIDVGELPALVSAFMETYEVVAPVKRGRSSYACSRSSRSFRRDRRSTIPRPSSSPKKYFLPPNETLLEFDACGNQRDGASRPEITPRGSSSARTRATSTRSTGSTWCSSDGRYTGPLLRARAAAPRSMVGDGLHCPPRTCFCHLWGSRRGAATVTTCSCRTSADKYLVSISSVEAANILESACDPREATDRGPHRASGMPPGAARPSFNPDIPDIQDVAMLMDAFHKDDVLGSSWAAAAFPAPPAPAVCPTCFCFDLQDRAFDPDGTEGRARARVWDACTSPQFASGGGWPQLQARRTGGRVRHRMYHKLNGFLANHDRMLCVGCGRCVKACKADINPIKVLEVLQAGRGRDDASVAALAPPARVVAGLPPGRPPDARSSGSQLMAANPYRPWPARITSITDLTATEKLFEFRLIDENIREAFSPRAGPVRGAFHLRRGGGAHLHLVEPLEAQASSSCASGARAVSPRCSTPCSAAISWAYADRSGAGFPSSR